ncbi:hypothetical protein TSH58p_07335 [Azospirillum sp. TSH58]|uniref:hypothetical protein n=1 Tax=Azospirillum sp. TSH58 TaxID=664962 RepID=UPI000D5FEF03|nr:hypothetical protein [Azospirillum sp. TSH58]AWJ83357.1 hypothetical protein TSH58p_07335 [Azospirillum sp. TSH58]PWC73104.1 hypothetical protein TSH58_05290 [Azospirillum sp. TSH58]
MSAPVTKSEVLSALKAAGKDITDPRRIAEAEYQAAATEHSEEARVSLRRDLAEIRKMGRR